MNVYQLYKPLRNQVSQYSLIDSLQVIWGWSQYEQLKDFSLPNWIELPLSIKLNSSETKYPHSWELELMAKEIIIHSNLKLKTKTSLKEWRQLSKCFNKLRKLENDIYGKYSDGNDVMIELMRISHRQFEWQVNRPHASSFIRYFKIFSHDKINEICKNKLDLSVREVFLYGFAMWATFESKSVFFLKDIKAGGSFKPEKLDNFLRFTGSSLEELKSKLIKHQMFDDRYAYAYNSLRETPLITVSNAGGDILLCPTPTSLFWRVTSGLYYEFISEIGFANPFGSSYQDYVGEVVEKAFHNKKFNILAEKEYLIKKDRKDSVDWIVYGKHGALFVECKAKRFSWEAKSCFDDIGPLQKELEGLAKSIVQVYKTIIDYQNNSYSHFSYDSGLLIFPVIVTLENWHLSGLRMYDMLNDFVRIMLEKQCIPSSILKEMPYSVCSIVEFEQGVQIMNAVGIVNFMKNKVNDREYAEWEWFPYINHNYSNTDTVQNLFEDEYVKIFEEVLKSPSIPIE